MNTGTNPQSPEPVQSTNRSKPTSTLRRSQTRLFRSGENITQEVGEARRMTRHPTYSQLFLQNTDDKFGVIASWNELLPRNWCEQHKAYPKRYQKILDLPDPECKEWTTFAEGIRSSILLKTAWAEDNHHRLALARRHQFAWQSFYETHQTDAGNWIPEKIKS